MIRGGGEPENIAGFNAERRMGLPPRSLAVEANDCFMVGCCTTDRIQACDANDRVRWRAPLGSVNEKKPHNTLDRENPIQAIFVVDDAGAVIDHREQHQRRLASALLDPERGFDLLEI